MKRILMMSILVLVTGLVNAQWRTAYFVDDFGDYTNDKYISAEFTNGKMSNSATSHSKAVGRIIITKEYISMKIYPYSYLSGQEDLTGFGVKIKTDDGKIIRIYQGFIYKDNYNYTSVYNNIIDAFKKGSKSFKVNAIKGTTNYLFNVSPIGFTKAFNNLYPDYTKFKQSINRRDSLIAVRESIIEQAWKEKQESDSLMRIKQDSIKTATTIAMLENAPLWDKDMIYERNDIVVYKLYYYKSNSFNLNSIKPGNKDYWDPLPLSYFDN